MDYNLQKIKHNNKDYIICIVRKKLIQVKPEEVFRQNLLYYLINELHYPLELIDVEVPLSYFKKGLKGRADIIIYKDDISKTSKTLILIECKAPDVDIRDYRFKNQIEGYNVIVNAEFSILTNGKQFEIRENKSQKLLEKIPSFSELFRKKKLNYIVEDKYEWVKHNGNEIFNSKYHELLINNDIISSKTKIDSIPPIIRLADLIYGDKDIFSPIKVRGLALVKDYGLRYTNYGYAFSDGLTGYYRYFLYRQIDGNHRIISLSLYQQDDMGTYLMVAVDDRQGHALELNLDTYLTKNKKGKYLLWHNGSITVGRKGRLKNAVVLNYLDQKAPHIVENNKVMLGSFDIQKDLKFNTDDINDMMFRIVEYVILREEIRTQH
jgi:hypothetical protein